MGFAIGTLPIDYESDFSMSTMYCNGLTLCYGAFDATTKECSVQQCGEHVGLNEVK